MNRNLFVAINVSSNKNINFYKTTIIYNYNLDNDNQIVYNIIYKYNEGGIPWQDQN